MQPVTTKYLISSDSVPGWQTELLSLLFPESPVGSIEVTTQRYFDLNNLKRFQWGTEAHVFTTQDWPFVIKIFIDDFHDDVWAINTVRSYRIAKQKGGGLISDFSFCGYSSNPNLEYFEPAVVMRKVELDDFTTTLRHLTNEHDIETAIGLLRSSVDLFEHMVARGITPYDLKLENLGVLDRRLVWLDAGLMTDEYTNKDLLGLSQKHTIILHLVKSINPDLGDFYRQLLSTKGYNSFEAQKDLFDRTFGKEAGVRVPDVLPQAFQLLRD